VPRGVDPPVIRQYCCPLPQFNLYMQKFKRRSKQQNLIQPQFYNIDQLTKIHAEVYNELYTMNSHAAFTCSKSFQEMHNKFSHSSSSSCYCFIFLAAAVLVFVDLILLIAGLEPACMIRMCQEFYYYGTTFTCRSFQ
jgi:hypothetical protein